MCDVSGVESSVGSAPVDPLVGSLDLVRRNGMECMSHRSGIGKSPKKPLWWYFSIGFQSIR